MNQIIKIHSAAVIFIAITLAGKLVSFAEPSMIIKLGCIPDRAFTFEYSYSLMSYALVQGGGIVSAGLICISIALSSLLISGYVRQDGLILYSIISIPVSAATFCILENNPSGPLVGTVMISWVFGGAALICGIRRWRELRLIGKLYVVIIVLNIISLPIEMLSIAVAQFVSLLIGISTGLFLYVGQEPKLPGDQNGKIWKKLKVGSGSSN